MVQILQFHFYGYSVALSAHAVEGSDNVCHFGLAVLVWQAVKVFGGTKVGDSPVSVSS